MSFHMVYRDGGHIPCKRQRTSNGCADEQRADQPRSCGIRHRINLFRTQPRLFQRRLDQRHRFADMIAGGQFRYDPAVVSV